MVLRTLQTLGKLQVPRNHGMIHHIDHHFISGNNVISNWGGPAGAVRQTGPDLQFIYEHNPLASATDSVNRPAAIINAFYVVNTVHDIAYKYGFTESTFNFQNKNFGKGGLEKDRITVYVQDRSDWNNAYFISPPDGQGGTMRMFLWDRTVPERDGALANDIVAHEVCGFATISVTFLLV